MHKTSPLEISKVKKSNNCATLSSDSSCTPARSSRYDDLGPGQQNGEFGC